MTVGIVRWPPVFGRAIAVVVLRSPVSQIAIMYTFPVFNQRILAAIIPHLVSFPLPLILIPVFGIGRGRTLTVLSEINRRESFVITRSSFLLSTML